MYIKKSVLICCTIAVMIATVVLTVGIVNPFGFTATAEFMQFSLFSKFIQESFYKDVDPETYMNYAIDGIAAGTEDPYTQFYWGEDAKAYTESLSGNFSGVGIQIVNNTEDDTITVVAPIAGGPAESAGIVPGDKILAVDGVPYAGSQLDEAVENMRGEPETSVSLTILKYTTNEVEEVKLVRQVINLASVEGKMLDESIGCISISQFTENTFTDFADKFHGLTDEGMEALVLDLRNNPGGILDTAVEIADLFLDEEKTIVSIQDKNGVSENYVATEGKVEMPIVVLTNQGTASASEVLLGALKDHGLAWHIGEPTFGKGVVQRVGLFEDSVLSITYAQYFTPAMRSIHDIGLYPDELIEMENYANLSKLSVEEDPQLKAAIAYLTK